MAEFARSQPTAVLTGAASPTSAQTFSPWRSVIRSAGRRLTAAGAALPPDPLVTAPGTPGDRHAGLDGADVAHRLLALLGALGTPVVVVLEDAHWMDPASLRLLDHLAPLLAAEPVLVVATVRTTLTGEAPIALPSPHERLELGGMGEADLAKVLRERYPALVDARIDAATRRLVAGTGGNPLALLSVLVRAERAYGPHPPLAKLADLGGGATPAPIVQSIEALLGGVDDVDRVILGAGCLVGDLNAEVVAAATGLTTDRMVAALAAGVGSQVLDDATAPPRVVHPLIAQQLAQSVPADLAQRVHAAAAERLAAGPALGWADAVWHAQRSGTLVARHRLVALADSAGERALHELAFEDADRLLAIAEADADPADLASRVRRVLLRGRANQRMGDLASAQRLYRDAADLAEQAGDAESLAEAAIGFAYPPDWRAGDHDALVLLDRAERLASRTSTKVELKALRSVLYMRIPRLSADGRQWSWLVRADVAQPLADEALDAAEALGEDDTLLFALVAWRSTHRAPRHLDRRRAVSRRALDLALRTNQVDQVVEVCVRLANDGIEAGRRSEVDEAVDTAMWAARRSREPRLLWRAHAVAALHAAQAPGATAVMAALVLHRATSLPDPELVQLVTAVTTAAAREHPLGSAGLALCLAMAGRGEESAAALDQAITLLDAESSLLQAATMAARAAALIEDTDAARRLLAVLQPWEDHVAVDSDTIMSAGPVSTAVADLGALLGRSPGPAVHLTTRQVQVLRLLATGLTNTQIATELHFSLATVRRETIRIYERLEVSGRAEAVMRAARLGLLPAEG